MDGTVIVRLKKTYQQVKETHRKLVLGLRNKYFGFTSVYIQNFPTPHKSNQHPPPRQKKKTERV